MSFAEKISQLIGTPQAGQEDQPMVMRYGSKVLAIVAAFFCILFGLYNCISIIFLNVGCLVAGMLQMLIGFSVMSIEAPVCCFFIDYVKVVSEKVEARPLWNKAALYCVISIPPIFFCTDFTGIFGSALVFAAGVLYGMMSLGKKATREDMAAVASPTTMQPGSQMDIPPTSDQHVTLMEDPDVWRPT